MNVLVFWFIQVNEFSNIFYNGKKNSLYDLHTYGKVLAQEPLPH